MRRRAAVDVMLLPLSAPFCGVYIRAWLKVWKNKRICDNLAGHIESVCDIITV
jgi:hypothetical protein